MRRTLAYLLVVRCSITLLSACTDSTVPARPPSISQLRVAPNLYNGLSVVITFRVADADSARVVYSSAACEATGATSYQRVDDGAQRIVALGLAADCPYTFAVDAAGTATVRSATVTQTTGALPALLQGVHLVTAIGTPPPGYTLIVPEYLSGNDVGFLNAGFLLAFDEAGDLRWYREFDGEGFAVEAKQLPNGDFTAYVGRSYGWQPTAGRFVEISPGGEIVRSFAVSTPFYTDPHEMLLTFRGGAIDAVHILGYDIRQFDLTTWNGPPDALLSVHKLERQNASGTREFLWDAADHFTPADWPSRNPAEPDLVHPSSLDMDADGNYIVSFQAMDEIEKIDAHTGQAIWRFGGRHNQFSIENDPRGGFHGQHSVRVLDNGNLLLLDNHTGATPLAARAAEYSLDTKSMVARLVWQYEPASPVANPVMGSVQRLSTGNTLVGFAAIGRVDEVDGAGNVVWEATLRDAGGAPIQFYRALRIASLYAYQRP